MTYDPPKPIRVLFDEWHSESWSCSPEKARAMSPEDPIGSSYRLAADLLAARDFIIERNTDGPLTAERLAEFDVLVFAHPCDPRWERTTSNHPASLSSDELHAIHGWMQHAAGGVFVITEYEHEKYGDNLNELLAPFGIRIENGKVFDRSACVHGNAEWFIAEPTSNSPLAYRAQRAVFYRAGWITSENHEGLAWKASTQAYPPNAAVIATGQFGSGRIVVVTDSVIFGDERLAEHDHAQLWLNLAYWLAAPRHRMKAANIEVAASRHELPPAWLRLKTAVNELRAVQAPDGSVPAGDREAALNRVESIRAELHSLAPEFSHESSYFSALEADFQKWSRDGFPRPNFTESLAAFRPQEHRRDGLETIAVFPMYTPNASSDTRFEALLFRTPWPAWLAQLERTRFPNAKFVPGHLVDFTDGYASECAVFFPETVSVTARPTNQFATIFCNREAARLQRIALASAEAVQLVLPPELEFWLNSRPMIEDTIALWDLIHDTSHSLGELPFDPFMIRQRAPFWMYGLEELRVDLRSYGEAQRLAADGFVFARTVTFAILLDRIFRFPITGVRVRNYDALGGQLLFAFLHQRDALIWTDNRLTIDWSRLDGEIAVLRDDLRQLYKFGSDCSKMSFWLAAHDLISRYVRPNIASRWRADSREVADEADLKHWLDLIHPDEFPLGTFHLNLQRRVAATRARA